MTLQVVGRSVGAAGTEALTEFLVGLEMAGASERNVDAHRQAVERLGEFMAPRAASEAEESDVAGFLGYLGELGVSAGSLAAYRKVLAAWREHLAARVPVVAEPVVAARSLVDEEFVFASVAPEPPGPASVPAPETGAQDPPLAAESGFEPITAAAPSLMDQAMADDDAATVREMTPMDFAAAGDGVKPAPQAFAPREKTPTGFEPVAAEAAFDVAPESADLLASEWSQAASPSTAPSPSLEDQFGGGFDPGWAPSPPPPPSTFGAGGDEQAPAGSGGFAVPPPPNMPTPVMEATERSETPPPAFVGASIPLAGASTAGASASPERGEQGPPPVEAPVVEHWGLRQGAKERNDLDLTSLRNMSVRGQVKADDLIRRPGGEWMRAGEFAPLRAVLRGGATAQAPAAPAEALGREPSRGRAVVGALLGAFVGGLVAWVVAVVAGKEVDPMLACVGLFAGMGACFAGGRSSGSTAAVGAAGGLAGVAFVKVLAYLTARSGVAGLQFAEAESFVAYFVRTFSVPGAGFAGLAVLVGWIAGRAGRR